MQSRTRLAFPDPHPMRHAPPVLLGFFLPATVGVAALALAVGYVADNGLAELAARYQVIDDAFYYLEIANNLRAGCGSSFDCLNATNGYHPLWLLLLVPLTAALPAPGDAQTWLALAASIGLFLAACTVITSTARRLMPEARLAPYLPAILLATNPSQFFVAINGLETPVAFLAITLLMDAASRALAPSPTEGRDLHGSRLVSTAPALALAAAGALAFLARLDYAIVAALALGTLLLADTVRLRRPSPRAVLTGAAFAAVVLGYLALNMALFDTATPVSGAIKRASPLDGFDIGYLYGPAGAISALFWPLRCLTWPGNPLLLALGVIPTVVAVLRARKSPAPLRDLLLSLNGWVHAALYLALQSSGPEYYFVPLVVSVAWSCGVTLEALEHRLSQAWAIMGAAALGALAVAGPIAAGVVLDRDRPVVPWRLDRLRAIAWMNETLPADAIIGSWWSGAVGYYTRQRVVNLDGLVNTRSYLNVLRGCGVGRYLIENDIGYLADYMTLSMIDDGTADETLFPGRCWAELWRDLVAAGYRLEPLRIFADPEYPQARGFVILALRHP